MLPNVKEVSLDRFMSLVAPKTHELDEMDGELSQMHGSTGWHRSAQNLLHPGPRRSREEAL